jgi:hypothetical protein
MNLRRYLLRPMLADLEPKVIGLVCSFGWQYSGAVIELLKDRDLRERLGRQGHEKAREQFDAAEWQNNWNRSFESHGHSGVEARVHGKTLLD